MQAIFQLSAGRMKGKPLKLKEAKTIQPAFYRQVYREYLSEFRAYFAEVCPNIQLHRQMTANCPNGPVGISLFR